ncbi:MAG: hypothetical protein KA319_08245 [Ferruginibacter sp.]|nr:hypothetical protein [Ferruginibacter sp.]
MNKLFLTVMFSCFYLLIFAQTPKKNIDTCNKCIYWIDINNSKNVTKDSVRIIGKIIIVASELIKPDYFAAITIDGKKYRTDKEGKVDVTLKNEVYSLKAFSGGSYPCTTETIKCNGGVIICVTFYLKSVVYVD